MFLFQYQQNFMVFIGGIIDIDWFQIYIMFFKFIYCVVYVDMNSGKVEDWFDYMVFMFVGMGVDGNFYIIDVV